MEDLARMMQKEFLSIKGEFGKVHKRFDKMDSRFDNFEKEIKRLRQDFEDLKLRQDQAAYGFEIKDIEKRLQKIELKIGIKAANA